MDEEALVEALRRQLTRPDPRVQVGIGDDAAVLAPMPAGAVVSVDAHVEEVHFRRAWLDPAGIALRATVAALSDLAAMGADAHAALVSWALPASDDDEVLRGLIAGLAEVSAAYDVPVVGGNVTRGPALAQHTTVIGAASAPVLRRGARPGDAIYVTGALGARALGLSALQAGDDDRWAAAWRRPTARLDRAALVRERASAAIDISDGLRSELGHLATASEVGMSVELARVPTLEGFAADARARGLDPEDLVAAGGEDYELLFTAEAGLDAAEARAIGEVTAAREIRLWRADGGEWTGRGGFRHR